MTPNTVLSSDARKEHLCAARSGSDAFSSKPAIGSTSSTQHIDGVVISSHLRMHYTSRNRCHLFLQGSR